MLLSNCGIVHVDNNNNHNNNNNNVWWMSDATSLLDGQKSYLQSAHGHKVGYIQVFTWLRGKGVIRNLKVLNSFLAEGAVFRGDVGNQSINKAIDKPMNQQGTSCVPQHSTIFQQNTRVSRLKTFITVNRIFDSRNCGLSPHGRETLHYQGFLYVYFVFVSVFKHEHCAARF